MAVGTKNSNLITKYDATTVVASTQGKEQGSVSVTQDTFEVVAEDVGDIGDVIKLARLESGYRPLSIQIWSDRLDTNGSPTLAMDLGIYLTDGTVKDADAFGSAVTSGWGTADSTPVEYITEAGAVPLANISKQMWEWAGDSEDDEIQYDINLKVTAAAATGAAGTISFMIWFTHS